MIVGVPKEIKNNENREMWGFFYIPKGFARTKR